jgi:hypothetical protein
MYLIKYFYAEYIKNPVPTIVEDTIFSSAPRTLTNEKTHPRPQNKSQYI